MSNGTFRDQAAKLYAERGYTKDPMTLALGICEEAGEAGEAGEVAKAINVFHNPLFVPSDHVLHSDSVEHEIKDLLLYMTALANSLNLEIKF